MGIEGGRIREGSLRKGEKGGKCQEGIESVGLERGSDLARVSGTGVSSIILSISIDWVKAVGK